MLEKKLLRDKLLTVIGPTSSGKSELAVKLAKKFNGEIISCDSRQIYKGMDLGTGKIKGKWIMLRLSDEPHKYYIYKSIIHHLIDSANPKKQYSVALFQKQAQKIIADILARGKLPILCGGTMHWVDAVVYNQNLPNVQPNPKLRARLEKKTTDELFHQLLKLDPTRAANIDKFNKRRLIRALEIVMISGRPIPPISYKLKPKSYSVLWLGINLPQTKLFAKIKSRLKQRLKQGMIAEVKKLHQYSPPQIMGRVPRRGGRGLSWKSLDDFGLEYRFCSRYLRKLITYNEMFEQLFLSIKHYSKRQITWWKRNKEIVWIKPDIKTAEKIVKKFAE